MKKKNLNKDLLRKWAIPGAVTAIGAIAWLCILSPFLLPSAKILFKLIDAVVILTAGLVCSGYTTESAGKPLSNFQQKGYRFIDLTYRSMRHPIQTISAEADSLGHERLAGLKLAYSIFSLVTLAIGSIFFIIIFGSLALLGSDCMLYGDADVVVIKKEYYYQ